MVPYFGQKNLKAENFNLPGILGYEVWVLAESTSHMLNSDPQQGVEHTKIVK